MFTDRPEHLTSFDYRGLHRYFLTFCTFDRHPAFKTFDRVDLVRTQFRRTAVEQRFAILAYCFMRDHVHLLVEGIAEDSDGLRFIKNAKQYSGFYYQRSFDVKLWQRYGFERVLRDEENSLAVARYILHNPIRAGLVTAAEEYPFLGSDVYPIEAISEAIQLHRGWYGRSG